MAAGFRSPLPLWFGVAAPPHQAGYRSLLGFWFGIGIGSSSGTPASEYLMFARHHKRR